MTALATGATQQYPSVLTYLFSPVLWSAACEVRLAEQGRWNGKIPGEGSLVVEARAQRIGNLCCLPQTPQLGPNTPSHAVFGRHVCQAVDTMIEAQATWVVLWFVAPQGISGWVAELKAMDFYALSWGMTRKLA
jgi:hypothetical protein